MTVRVRVPVHARLLVDDPAAIGRWFVEHLGFEVRFGDLDGDGPYVELVRDGAPLGIYRVALMDTLLDGEAVVPNGDAVMIVVSVDDVDATVEGLRRRGVAIRSEPADRPDWCLRTAHVRTPTGVLVELNAPLGGGR